MTSLKVILECERELFQKSNSELLSGGLELNRRLGKNFLALRGALSGYQGWSQAIHIPRLQVNHINGQSMKPLSPFATLQTSCHT